MVQVGTECFHSSVSVAIAVIFLIVRLRFILIGSIITVIFRMLSSPWSSYYFWHAGSAYDWGHRKETAWQQKVTMKSSLWTIFGLRFHDVYWDVSRLS